MGVIPALLKFREGPNIHDLILRSLGRVGVEHQREGVVDAIRYFLHAGMLQAEAR